MVRLELKVRGWGVKEVRLKPPNATAIVHPDGRVEVQARDPNAAFSAVQKTNRIVDAVAEFRNYLPSDYNIRGEAGEGGELTSDETPKWFLQYIENLLTDPPRLEYYQVYCHECGIYAPTCLTQRPHEFSWYHDRIYVTPDGVELMSYCCEEHSGSVEKFIKPFLESPMIPREIKMMLAEGRWRW